MLYDLPPEHTLYVPRIIENALAWWASAPEGAEIDKDVLDAMLKDVNTRVFASDLGTRGFAGGPMWGHLGRENARTVARSVLEETEPGRFQFAADVEGLRAALRWASEPDLEPWRYNWRAKRVLALVESLAVAEEAAMAPDPRAGHVVQTMLAAYKSPCARFKAQAKAGDAAFAKARRRAAEAWSGLPDLMSTMNDLLVVSGQASSKDPAVRSAGRARAAALIGEMADKIERLLDVRPGDTAAAAVLPAMAYAHEHVFGWGPPRNGRVTQRTSEHYCMTTRAANLAERFRQCDPQTAGALHALAGRLRALDVRVQEATAARAEFEAAAKAAAREADLEAAALYGVHEGMRVEIETPKGPRELTVDSVSEDGWATLRGRGVTVGMGATDLAACAGLAPAEAIGLDDLADLGIAQRR